MAETLHFADNLSRLLGMHRLTGQSASRLLGVSKQSLSYWLNGHRPPSLESVAKLAETFEVDAMRLVYAPFPELLENELADVERYRQVELKLRKEATRLRFVGPKAVSMAEVGKHPKV
jgi:transcriptional regulator with XRE-family HTH domain